MNDRRPIAWMAGNTVAANLLMFLFLIGGVISGINIKKEFFPHFEVDTITVTVPYPGASPEEVEQAIILSIEDSVRGLDGVDEVVSRASEGVGSVMIELLEGANRHKLTQDVQNEVNRIVTFPEEAERPQVKLLTRRRNVITMVIYAEQDERLLHNTAEMVRDQLVQKPNITQVEMTGTRPLEISIEIPQDTLRKYNLTLGDVASKIRRSSIELPGGGIKTRGGEILLRVTERRDYGLEFANIPIVTLNDGTEVLLGDIADIVDGFMDYDIYATYNGKPAVMLDIYRVGKQTPIDISNTVKEFVEEFNATMPADIRATTMSDFSEIFRQRRDLLLRNGGVGLILVLTLLGIFLEPRLAFWVTMGIPTSFLGALFLMPMMGVSINVISMFAFIIALGIVVDDAIVVGENIHKHMHSGEPFLKAAVKGAMEVSMPVVFSILTNIVAFMPLFFVPGTTGKIFKIIPSVVVLAFIISLIECLFILPAHLSHGRKGKQRSNKALLSFISNVYRPFLERTLRARYITVAIGAAILIITLGFIKSGRMGFELFPKVESDFALATAVLPYGSDVQKTMAVQKHIIESAQKVAEKNGGEQLCEGIFALVGASSRGTSGGHVSQVFVFMTPPKVRPMNTDSFTQAWRKETGPIPGLESMMFQSDAGGPGHGSSLTVELNHRDIDVLEAASSELAEELSQFSNVKDIDDGFSPGKQQIDFTIKPEGESLGLTAAEIARQIRYSFYGAEALRQQRGRNEMKIMVRLPKEERVSEHNMEELIVRTPSGEEAQLREVANMKRGRAYTDINRRDGRRVVSVTANVIPNSAAGQIIADIKANALPRLTEKYNGLGYGFEGRQADMKESLGSLKVGFVYAMCAVFMLLAIPFRSYIQPIIVMVCIPFGLVGAVIGHMIMGYSLSIISMFGFVALSGVVVNDSLVLIDFANRERNRGLSPHDAIASSGERRFRPIMLTTLTTFGGLAPMILETSRQARFLIPMAISLGFGILFATLITLILVPSLYVIMEDAKSGLRKFLGRWVTNGS